MAERHVHADRDAAGDEVAQNRGTDPEQLLNRPGTQGGEVASRNKIARSAGMVPILATAGRGRYELAHTGR